MPSINKPTTDRDLTAKEQATVDGYCCPDSETYNHWGNSYLAAGYSACDGYERNALVVRKKHVVNEAIVAYRAKTGLKWEHDRQIAVDALNQNLLRLHTKADNGDVQAIAAATGIIRELNAISNLHKATLITEHIPDQPQGQEADVLNTLNKQYKLKLAGTSKEGTGAAPVQKQA